MLTTILIWEPGASHFCRPHPSPLPMGEGAGGVDRLPSPLGRGVGGEGVQLLSVNQGQTCNIGILSWEPPMGNIDFPVLERMIQCTRL
ncbi:MAG: hypothetical protein LVT47_04725 [Cyanobacteria bacterium LVE1205-1]